MTHKAPLTFTDPRPGGSSKSHKSGREAATDPTKPRYKSFLPPSSSSGWSKNTAAFVPVSYLNEDPASKDDSISDVLSDMYTSEGELPISLTISTLLSKLDSVKVGGTVY